jgi:hypothetical protein
MLVKKRLAVKAREFCMRHRIRQELGAKLGTIG